MMGMPALALCIDRQWPLHQSQLQCATAAYRILHTDAASRSRVVRQYIGVFGSSKRNFIMSQTISRNCNECLLRCGNGMNHLVLLRKIEHIPRPYLPCTVRVLCIKVYCMWQCAASCPLAASSRLLAFDQYTQVTLPLAKQLPFGAAEPAAYSPTGVHGTAPLQAHGTLLCTPQEKCSWPSGCQKGPLLNPQLPCLPPATASQCVCTHDLGILRHAKQQKSNSGGLYMLRPT